MSRAQGVVVAVASLVLALAQDNLEAYSICYQKAVNRLSKVSGPPCLTRCCFG